MIQRTLVAEPPLDDHAPELERVAALEARGVWAGFGDRQVLTGVDLTLEVGARLALIGSNGSGKTTLLRVLAGALRPTSGEVSIFSHSFSKNQRAARASVGVLGHQSYLYPELTAAENLTFYARLYRVQRCAERVDQMLEVVGLSHRRSDRVGTLSRGMVQRLALARAVVHDPPLLLLDEPDDGLDERSSSTLEAVLSTGAAAPRTILLTTHDLENALRFGDNVAVLHGGQVAAHRSTSSLGVAGLRAWYAAIAAQPRSAARQLVGQPAGTSF